MDASTIGTSFAVPKVDVNGCTEHVFPAHLNTKQFLPSTAMLAWESNSVLESSLFVCIFLTTGKVVALETTAPPGTASHLFLFKILCN